MEKQPVRLFLAYCQNHKAISFSIFSIEKLSREQIESLIRAITKDLEDAFPGKTVGRINLENFILLDIDISACPDHLDNLPSHYLIYHWNDLKPFVELEGTVYLPCALLVYSQNGQATHFSDDFTGYEDIASINQRIAGFEPFLEPTAFAFGNFTLLKADVTQNPGILEECFFAHSIKHLPAIRFLTCPSRF